MAKIYPEIVAITKRMTNSIIPVVTLIFVFPKPCKPAWYAYNIYKKGKNTDIINTSEEKILLFQCDSCNYRTKFRKEESES